MEKELERKQALNLEISLNGDKLEELTKIDNDEGNYFFAIGVKFCPKTQCINNELELTFDPTEKEPGICFDIFKVVFDKLKERKLIQEYDINELECYIEAFHPDYRFLELISSVQTSDYYGIGFDLVNLKTGILLDSIEQVNEIRNWLNEVILIINEIKPLFDILSNDNLEYKIENFVDIEMHSLED